MKLHNPIIPGFYPDPSICRVGKDYYLVTSSFEYFPGVPIFHSRDLVNWRQIGHCLSRESQLPLMHTHRSEGIWAPTLRHHNGTFYMATTNQWGVGHFYVTATDPAGQWSEPIYVKTTNEDCPVGVPHLEGGIGWDASLFFDDDGAAYFQWYLHTVGIMQSEIEIETGTLLTEPRMIWGGAGWKSPEGPHTHKIGDMYYLLAAEGGTEYGHMVTVGRSQSVWGPFDPCPHNPIISHRSLDNPIQGTGHGDMVQDHRGQWWLVFLAFRPHGYPPVYHLGRETYLAPIKWTDDGWPIVGENGRIQPEMSAPLLPAHPWPAPSPRDDFDNDAFADCWNFLRNPVSKNYSLNERPGWLTLHGRDTTLDDGDSPTFIGRRQQHFNASITALIDFEPEVGQEAGLTIFQNERHHYEIGVTCEAEQKWIFVRHRIGKLQQVMDRYPVRDGELILRIDAQTEAYYFSYKQGEGDFVPMHCTSGETRYLSVEVGGMNTGVYIGMYAVGKGARAQFNWFEYEARDG